MKKSLKSEGSKQYALVFKKKSVLFMYRAISGS